MKKKEMLHLQYGEIKSSVFRRFKSSNCTNFYYAMCQSLSKQVPYLQCQCYLHLLHLDFHVRYSPLLIKWI